MSFQNQHEKGSNISLIATLQKDFRDESDLLLIMKATRHLKFFKELNSKTKNGNIVYSICNHLQYRAYKQGQIIFKQQQQTDNFYVILTGNVNIFQQKTYLNVEIEQSLTEYQNLESNKKSSHPSELLQRIQKSANNISTQVLIARYQTEINLILKETGDIPIQAFEDFPFFFHFGVFTQNLITQLYSGDIFGELGLLLGQPRSATVVAQTDCELLFIEKYHYQQILQGQQLRKVTNKLNFLFDHFFIDQKIEAATSCAYDFKKQTLQRGAFIYRQNEIPQLLYIIKSGEVELLCKQNNNLIRVVTLGPGSIFGEVEYFMQSNRLYTAVVISPLAKFLCLQFQQFKRALIEMPDLESIFTQKILMKTEYHLDQMKRTTSIRLNTEPISKPQTNNELLLRKVKDKIKTYKQASMIPSKQETLNSFKTLCKGLSDIQVSHLQLNKMIYSRPNLMPIIEQEKFRQHTKSSYKLRKLLNIKEPNQVPIKDIVSFNLSVKNRNNTSILIKEDDIQLNRSSSLLFKNSMINRLNNFTPQRELNQNESSSLLIIKKQQSSQSPTKSIIVTSKHNMFRRSPTNQLLLQQNYRQF